MRKFLTLVVLGGALNCASGIASGIGLAALRKDYEARFLVHGESLYVEVQNVPGINLAAIEPVHRDDKLCLAGTFVSSGGPGRRVFKVNVGPMGLPSGWERSVYWAEPDGQLSHVEVERVDQAPIGG